MRVKAVILDWAGTAVDYGCRAPLIAFKETFEGNDVEITTGEARRPMGLSKEDHLRALLAMPRVAARWEVVHGRPADESDVKRLYEELVPLMTSILGDHAELIPGVVEAMGELREAGLRIGSTTGYTDRMMHVLAPLAARRGFAPDCVVTPDGLPAGRPYPWMCYKNAIMLETYPLCCMVKVGDTVSDVLEGVNAGCWSVGVLEGGSEVGLSEGERRRADARELHERRSAARERLLRAGAHFVIDDLTELPSLVSEINGLLAEGQTPSYQEGTRAASEV